VDEDSGLLQSVFAVVLACAFIGVLALVFYAVKSSAKGIKNASGVGAPRRVYSLLWVNINKNKIATNTELTVSGAFNGEALLSMESGLDPACYWYMVNGRVRVQHGDDPRAYCNFPVLLTNGEAGSTVISTPNGDETLASMLTCNMNAPSFKVLDTYINNAHSNQISALKFHGYYSATLDFTTVATIPGAHFGIPMLDECTLLGP
jgi:hypothetical protein